MLNHNNQGQGTFFRCFFLAKHLSNYGNEVVLSCVSPARNAIRTKIMNTEDITIYLLAGQHGSSSITELPFHIIRAIINLRLAVTGRFDVIYSFSVASPTTGFPVICLRLLKTLGFYKPKIVVDWDDWWGKGGLSSIDNKGWLVESLTTSLEVKIPRLADKVTVVSDVLRERALQAGVRPDNVYLLPNGANVKRQSREKKDKLRKKLGLPLDNLIVCYVGRALTIFDYLLDSIEIMKNNSPDTIVLFIAPLNILHIKKINDLGLTKTIISVGEQSYERLLLYLRASDVLLLPRADNKSERANYPARLGDYMAAGRPIVTTAIGESEKVILNNKCGLSAKPNDSMEFSAKILKLLNNPQLREEMGRRGRKVAERALSWEIITKQLQDILSN
jgi:glycosyltransferase involved in cell wall biosynthesis